MKVALLSGSSDLINCNQLEPLSLLNPRTNGQSLYLLDSKNHLILESVKFSDDYRSWFINDSVQEEGDILFVTQVDIIFVILPYIMKKRRMFCSIHDILLKESNDDGNTSKLLECFLAVNPDISVVSDCKEVDDEIYVKYNEDKTLQWLKCKVEAVVGALKKNRISASLSGSRMTGFTTGRENEDFNKDALLKYSYELVSDYLCEEVSKALRDYLGIPSEKSIPSPAGDEKRNKRKVETDSNVTPLEDYSVKKAKRDLSAATSTDSADAKRAKMTRAQKELLKVDKKGMKSISSFFKMKTK